MTIQEIRADLRRFMLMLILFFEDREGRISTTPPPFAIHEIRSKWVPGHPPWVHPVQSYIPDPFSAAPGPENGPRRPKAPKNIDRE